MRLMQVLGVGAVTVVLFASLPVAAEQTGLIPRTAHTFQLAEGVSRPSATIDDVAWLAGSWRGEAFGKQFEEHWSEPSAGSMVGSFKLMDGDTIELYELMVLSVLDGVMGLKVKHFSSDFVGWEDRPDYVHFKLVAIEPDALHFSGLSFYRRGPAAMDAYIVMRDGSEIREEHLVYQRVK
jgi:hypothetical protein